uniref:Uncharacterized protein n=1 Tax=Magallana gigas TaxID=29159 RepID=A0A8W8NWH7_MAGGI
MPRKRLESATLDSPRTCGSLKGACAENRPLLQEVDIRLPETYSKLRLTPEVPSHTHITSVRFPRSYTTSQIDIRPSYVPLHPPSRYLAKTQNCRWQFENH